MRLMRTLTLVAAGALAIGCSSTTNPQDVTVADLVGTWTASRFAFTNVANTAQKFDVITNGGSFAVTVASNGTIDGTYNFIFDSGDIAGTIAVSGGVVTFVNTAASPPDTLSFTDFALNGNTFTLTGNYQEIPLAAFTGNAGDLATLVNASLAVVLTR
jgi:hypothetical protein